MTVTERDSLLKNTAATGGGDLRNGHAPPRHLGPLELSPQTRQRILIGIWLAQFLSALNLTLVPTMLPSISSDFNRSNQASWLGTSYLLATCTFTPLYGRLCNAMGRRGANQSAALFAAAGILACGLSTSMKMLIVSRFISGIGGGGIFTTSAIITSDMYNLRTRGFVQSIGGIFYGLGMGLGGPVGGLITDWLGWRWAFLMQIPLFALSLALTTCNLRYVTPGKKGSTMEILKRIDYGGSLTILCGVGSMLYFLSTRYNEARPWTDPHVYTPLAVSLLSLPLFLLIETRLALEPVLAPALLTQKVPLLVGGSNALVAVCNLSVTYFFPVWFQTVMLSSASTAGLHLLPNSICISMGSLFAGYVMRRTGRYKTLNLTFGTLPLLGALLFTQMHEHSSPAHLWLSIIPLGFGNAVVLQTMYIALVAHLPEHQMAIGTGFAQLLRGLGQVGGLAAASALFQSRLDVELHKRIRGAGAEETINHIRHSARLVSTLPPALQRAARDAYAASLWAVFVLAAGASLGAFLLRLWIPDKDLTAPQETEVQTESCSSSVCGGAESGYESDDEGKGGYAGNSVNSVRR
ncbi:Multidrug resistance protein fnx1 [Hypsizygus marmoreus]|uniref:Multidrug resistance protein fnx1 n=1 Tax=Hypsizygus marmoreus TaxID=39966 RepID=A0A369JDC2_HYPMA|nr:Multidrug resistance protein fnx1 [Hypsizygus marmoreus]